MSERQRFQVAVSGRARDMLMGHARFLAQVSIRAGEELFDEFEQRVSSLEEMPERCAHYNNPYVPSGKYRWLSLGKHYQIIFQIVADSVYIELILDARAENKTQFST